MKTKKRRFGTWAPSGWRYLKVSVAVVMATVCIQTAVAQQRSSDQAVSIAIQKRSELINKANGALMGGARSRAFNKQTMSITGSSEVAGRLIEKELLLTHGRDAKAAAQMLNALRSVGNAFYICQDKEAEGFVVVSGDERMSEVLAYSLTGRLDVDSLPQGARELLLTYVANKLYLDTNIIPKAQKRAMQTSPRSLPMAGAEEVGPLLTTNWGQSYPFNAACPYYDGTHQAVTGCVATAMAQGMNYYKFPTTGKRAHSYTSATHHLRLSKDFSATTFQWDKMQNTYPTSNVPQDQVDAIADLMLSCGVSVDMDYDTESAASQTDQVVALQKYFGYDQDMAIATKDCMPLSAWHNLFIRELNAKRPLMISGYSTGGYGHAFIIDGYTPDGDDYPYYHVNWGWRGEANGSYKMDNMQDSEHNTGVYSVNLAAIINFMPDNGVEDNPSFMQIASVESQSQTVDLTQGQSLALDITQCINGSVKPFSGTITLYLVDNKGARTAVQSLTLNNVGTSYFYSGTQNCSVPSTLVSGKYSIAATAQASGSDKVQEIEIGNVGDSVVIINDQNIYYPSVMATALTTSLSGANNFSVAATNVCNFADRPFSGTLQMIVCDHYGKFVAAFGSIQQLNNLPKYSRYSTTYNFRGALTESLSDGAYQINLGACQNGYNSWSAVKKYVLNGNSITDWGLDATTPFYVRNGRISLTCPYVEGDANQDGSLNVADLQALIRMILRNYSTRDFAFFASDLDVNARLNVADFSLLVPKVLNAAGSRRFAQSNAFPAADNEGGEAMISVEGALLSVDEDGATYRVDINLSNADREVNALQFDLRGGAEIEILADSATTSLRTPNFRIAQSGGRVLLYNMDDANISGNEGTVLSLRLKRRDALLQGGLPVSIDDVILSMGDDCSAIRSASVGFTLDVSGVKASEGGLTGLQGVSSIAGLTIEGGKGVIIIHNEAFGAQYADNTAHNIGDTTQSPAPSALHIYSLDGQRVATVYLRAGETTRVSLPRGIYVVGNKKITVR